MRVAEPIRLSIFSWLALDFGAATLYNCVNKGFINNNANAIPERIIIFRPILSDSQPKKTKNPVPKSKAILTHESAWSSARLHVFFKNA